MYQTPSLGKYQQWNKNVTERQNYNRPKRVAEVTIWYYRVTVKCEIAKTRELKLLIDTGAGVSMVNVSSRFLDQTLVDPDNKVILPGFHVLLY